MISIKVKTLGAVLAASAATLERNYGIQVSGLFDVAYSRNNRSTHDERQDVLSNLPVVGGLEWVACLLVDKPHSTSENCRS